MESTGCGKIGDHNLPDALYASCTWKGSAETSNSGKECTTYFTLHTHNMRKQVEHCSALKVRNTRFLRGSECELKWLKSEFVLMTIYPHKSEHMEVTHTFSLT